MFDKFVNSLKKCDIPSYCADDEKLRNHADEPFGGQLAQGGPQKSACSRRLQRDATARISVRTGKCSTQCDYSLKAAVEWAERWGCAVAALGLLLGPPGVLLCASHNGNQPASLSARELVKDVTRKEQIARKNPQNYYKFIQKEETPDGTITSIRIETPNGEIGEAVAVNGKPPSKAQCRKDADSLKKLASNPKVQQRQSREQQDQSDRIDRLIAAVPDAFIFQYQGKQQGSEWIGVTFRPNPRFQPQSHEASLLKGMQGTLWVDPSSHRLAKINGTLMKDVNFGWGFLASLKQGGHFEMQQSIVPGGSWKQTFLGVDLDGSKLVFGQLHAHFKDWSQSFVKLTDPGNLAETVSMLEHSPIACNESQGTGTTAQADIH